MTSWSAGRAMLWTAWLALRMASVSAVAQEACPVTITPEVRSDANPRELVLLFQVPAHHHLYADRLSAELAGQPVNLELPEATMELDKHSGMQRAMYQKDFTASVKLPPASGDELLTINLQGCNEAECYFPESRQWRIRSDQTLAAIETAGSEPANRAGAGLLAGFQVSQRGSGFMGKKEFLSFLDRSAGGSAATARSASVFAGMGALATIGLILVGGLALNLTPCVLPMIPINLAILGAGATGGNRRRGFALGGAYGAGMALAYGSLGLAVVLAGARFGTLNSSPWFNIGIAIVFSILGLAMFDQIAIDLSRFQRTGRNARTGNAAFLGAAAMGAVSALLAGACVAPVVIGVLLLATTSYQSGNVLGLLYPFVLGLGMALPWPLAASGLSFLPKPGVWMTRVKHGFGVLIFGFALWYGWLGLSLTGWGTSQQVSARTAGNAVGELRAALEKSSATGKPVLVDFWASWCKNCSAMEHTTLQDNAVRERLDDFLVVRFQAERLEDEVIRPTLEEFGVLGLPTFVVVYPNPDGTDLPAPSATLH